MKSTTGTESAGARERHAAASSNSRIVRRICAAIACVLVALFLVSIRRYYHRDSGFTALIGFAAGHGYEAPGMRGVAHYDYAGVGVYDGQFYAQLALDPLLRDPLTDRAMDLAPFRARRILFSWTAYLAGLGRPAWILEAYALQNVVTWLVLAVLLARWMPPSSPRGLAAWAVCLFSHGLLWSVRFALLDGPSLALMAYAIRLSEDRHPFSSAIVAGINGLGRETNVLGVFAQPLPRSRRDALRFVAAVAMVALPLLIWADYLFSIYRSTIFAAVNEQTSLPGVQFASVLSWTLAHASAARLDLCILASLLVESVFLATQVRRLTEPWWRVGAAYVVLLLVLDRVLVTPSTGAITRVMLPLTVAFNVLLVREPRGSRFWPLWVAGNLHVIPGLGVL